MIRPPNEPITDEMWSDLHDWDDLPRRQAAAEERYRDLTSDQINFLRRRAKNDLFFLATGPLEYDLLSVQLHGHFSNWLRDTRGERYRIELLPRGHYKTTLATITESVQIALPNEDDKGSRIVDEHPWSLGPNVKILISHETRDGAARALFEITEAFMRKPLMLALFPELVPSRRKQRVNKLELELPRTQYHKEPTFDVIGVGGAAQGRHYHRLKLDDLVGEDARDSLTVMRRTLDWFDNVHSLLTRLKLDGWDLTGTRWALHDVYSHALKKYGVKYAQSVLRAMAKNREKIEEGIAVCYARGAIENGLPIFPEEFSLEDLEVIRKNRKVWAAQYANNPLDDDLTEFSAKWLKFYNVHPSGDLIIFEGEKGLRRLSVRSLDRTILIDPSMGETDDADETGIVVCGTDFKNNIYVLETIRKRLKPPDFIRTLMQLYMKWWPRVVAIEDVNFSGIYKYWFDLECARLRIYPNIFPYKVRGRAKEARVRGLANFGAAGQIYCLEGMNDFRDEWEAFGVIDKYHLLDALAQGPEVWQPGLRKEDVRAQLRAEKYIEEQRSMETGY